MQLLGSTLQVPVHDVGRVQEVDGAEHIIHYAYDMPCENGRHSYHLCLPRVEAPNSLQLPINSAFQVLYRSQAYL